MGSCHISVNRLQNKWKYNIYCAVRALLATEIENKKGRDTVRAALNHSGDKGINEEKVKNIM